MSESSKVCGDCAAVKPLDDFHGQKAGKDGRQRICKLCSKVRTRKYREQNPEVVGRHQKEYYERTRGVRLQARREYVQNNIDSVRFKQKEYDLKNREERRTYAAGYREVNRAAINAKIRAYAKLNPAKRRANGAAYRAAKLKATPVWADKTLIAEFYNEATILASDVGARYDVDHIIPLNSSLVCGLHNQFNLQVILREDNQVKGNRAWPDMW